MNPLKHLRRYFIPGKHNQFKPHFFRLQAVFATAGIIGFLFFIAASLNTLVIRSGSSQLGAVVTSTLVALANTDRGQNNLHELTVSPVLQKAAQLKADDMAAKGYFAHNSPEGLTPWHWFNEAGYNFAFAGENLAVYFSDSAELEKAWMNSPLHRANILNSYFTEIGIATAKGTYQGKETVYVVQEFGRPSKRIASSAVKPTDVSNLKKTPVSLASNNQDVKKIPSVKGVTAGEEPLKVVAKEDTFIAVQNSDEEAADIPTGGNLAVAGTSAPTILSVAASPWTLLRMVYAVLALLITCALLLMISVEIKRQHPLHIAYGASLLVLMGVLLYSWQGLFFGKLLVM
jgi:hypothetical protein